MNRFDRHDIQAPPRKTRFGVSSGNWLSRDNSTAGFTLLELLVALVMLGVLAAIAAPSWQAFLNRQRLNTAQNQVMEVLKQAQQSAKQHHIPYQASFREQANRVQWAIHPTQADPMTVPWNALEEGIKLDAETTLARDNSIYRMQFNHRGEVNGQLGRVTLSLTSGGGVKRCVFVSNLLGAMRTGENRPTRQGNPCE
jgi:prepilin-type N-terminal cleavage/methylation domain-containing protein